MDVRSCVSWRQRGKRRLQQNLNRMSETQADASTVQHDPPAASVKRCSTHFIPTKRCHVFLNTLKKASYTGCCSTSDEKAILFLPHDTSRFTFGSSWVLPLSSVCLCVAQHGM